jgi:2,3,4,5-tetrahydropyridine-2-carboxylate N-succinyltransferase
MTLKTQIERLFDLPASSLDKSAAFKAFNELRFFLNNGELRPANPTNSGLGWKPEPWVKKGIVVGLRASETIESTSDARLHAGDVTSIPFRRFTSDQQVHLAPGGTVVRDGSFIGSFVNLKPPTFVDIGVYIDEKTTVGSHVLIGACAQLGKNVTIDAGTQIGGVLEPVTSLPVIVEDNVVIGGQCGIFDSVVIKRNVIIGAGVLLNAAVNVFDCINNQILRASAEKPLVIPEGAVVVMGARRIKGTFAEQHGLSLSTPLIVKYRDHTTDPRKALEDAQQ